MRHRVKGDILNTLKKSVLLIFILSVAILFFIGCAQKDPKEIDLNTEYQGVLLINGTGYFGKIEKIGPRFVTMTEVYYVKNQQNPETKEVQSLLVKRGREWHAPDIMFINMEHVIMIEPVAPKSNLFKIIKDLKTKVETENKK